MTSPPRRKSHPRFVVRRGRDFRRQQQPGEIIVLIVEGHASTADGIAGRLRTHGVSTFTAGSVTAARAVLDAPARPLAAIVANAHLHGDPHAGIEVVKHALAVRPPLWAMITTLQRTTELDTRIACMQVPTASLPLDPLVAAAFVRVTLAKHGSEHARRIAIIDSLGDAAELTEAEREASFYLSLGLVVKEIMQAMGLEESTVRGNLEAVRRKLGVHSANAILGRLLAVGLRRS
jgi:DNA-binding NarL/FixJ family response regulator